MATRSNKVLLYYLPLLYILINLVALALGMFSLKKLSIYADIIILVLWLPLINIALSALVIVYGVASQKVNLYAKASLLVALLFWMPALNIFTSALAMVFGIVSMKEIRLSKEKGNAYAITGITIGVVTLLLSFLSLMLTSFFPGFLS